MFSIEPIQTTAGEGCEPEERLFLALFEIERFDGLKRTIGYAAAIRLLGELAEEIATRLAGIRSTRADRALIEVVLAADSADAARSALHAVAAAIARRIVIEDYGFDLALVIGFVDMGGSAVCDELVGAAERALSAARVADPRLASAEAAIRRDAIDRLALLRALQAAIRDDALSLHYQPKIGARTGEVAALEALVRWHCPRLGTITPDMFIPIAEETGDIRAMTEWVLKRAIRDQQALARAGMPQKIDINLPSGFLDDDIFTRGLIERTADAVGPIGFEITETSTIADPVRALANLQLCAAAGVGLAIDDYGSGFSSLAYLRQLPVDELKIDRAFISRLTSHPRDPLLVRSTIDLAHALEMRVTAEGIETAQVLALLQVMGCDMLQGYFLARPMPLADLTAYLAGCSARDLVRSQPQRLPTRATRAGGEG